MEVDFAAKDQALREAFDRWLATHPERKDWQMSNPNKSPNHTLPAMRSNSSCHTELEFVRRRYRATKPGHKDILPAAHRREPPALFPASWELAAPGVEPRPAKSRFDPY